MGIFSRRRRQKELIEITAVQAEIFDELLTWAHICITTGGWKKSVAEHIECVAESIVRKYNEPWSYDEEQKKIYIHGAGLPLDEFQSVEELVEAIFATDLFFKSEHMSMSNDEYQLCLNRAMAAVGQRWSQEFPGKLARLMTERGSPADLDSEAKAQLVLMDDASDSEAMAKLMRAPDRHISEDDGSVRLATPDDDGDDIPF